MYKAIKDSGYKIDTNNLKYLVEELQDFSYINYNDYPHWDTLKNKIITI